MNSCGASDGSTVEERERGSQNSLCWDVRGCKQPGELLRCHGNAVQHNYRELNKVSNIDS